MRRHSDSLVVRAAWCSVPVMIAQVVSGLGVKAGSLDQSSPAARQPHTADDLRFDEAELLRWGVRHWASVWWEALRAFDDVAELPVGADSRCVADDWERVAGELVPLVEFVDREWEEVELFGELWEQFLEDCERWLLPSWREFGKSGRSAPRQCRRCGSEAVRWDATVAAVRCLECRHEYGGELWLPVSDAAAQLGVSERTIWRWLSAPGSLVRASGEGSSRRVEVNSCRAEMQARAARQRLGKKPGTSVSGDVIASA